MEFIEQLQFHRRTYHASCPIVAQLGVFLLFSVAVSNEASCWTEPKSAEDRIVRQMPCSPNCLEVHELSTGGVIKLIVDFCWSARKCIRDHYFSECDQ
ncbi:hypothetical protein COOONC_10832 [Cooperia oncophora]